MTGRKDSKGEIDVRSRALAIDKLLKAGTSRDGQVAAAKRVLDFAMVGEDVEALEAALEWAISKGSPEAMLEQPRKRLVVLADMHALHKAKNEALHGLKSAMEGSSPEALESAIKRAVSAGIGSTLIKQAWERKSELEKQAAAEAARKEQEKTCAAKALELAQQSGNVPGLEAAINEAVRLEVDEKLITKARHRLQKRVEEEQKLAARDKAKSNLEEAMKHNNLQALNDAIQQAVNTGVSEEVMQLATSKRKQLEEQARSNREQAAKVRALEEAMHQTNIEALQRAIDAVTAFDPTSDVVKAAHKRKRALEDQKKQSEIMMATNVLEHALLGEDIAALDSAIEYAEKAGVKAGLIDKARKRKLQMQEMVRLRQMRSQATQTLQLALAGKDLLALVHAYNVAFQAGVAEDLLARARKHKVALEEKQKEREKAKKRKEHKQRKEESRGGGKEGEVSDEGEAQEAVADEEAHTSEEEQSERPKSAVKTAPAPAVESRRTQRTAAPAQPEPKEVPYTLEQATQILEFAMKEADVQELQAAIRIGTKAGVSEALLRKARERQEGLESGGGSWGRPAVDVVSREEAERQRATRRDDDHVGREREPRHRSRREAADTGRHAAEEAAAEGRHSYQAAKENGLSYASSREYREEQHERGQRGSYREQEEEIPREGVGRRAHLSRHSAEEPHQARHVDDRGLGRPPPPPLLTPRRQIEAERDIARNDSDADQEEPSRHRASRREEDLRQREKEPRTRPRREAAAEPPVARLTSQRGGGHEEDGGQRIRKEHGDAAERPARQADRPPSRAEARQIAEKALEQAVKGTEVEGLEAAIAEARERGVRDDLVKSSMRRLQELRVRAEQGKKASDAKKSLEYAVEHGQVQELRDAILHAVECGVDRSLVKQAVTRKQELEEEQQQKDQSRQAEQELLRVMAKGTSTDLSKTLEWAIKVGISTELVDKAWKRKEELDDEEAGRHGSQASTQRSVDVPQEKPDRHVTVRLTRRASAGAAASKGAAATSKAQSPAAAQDSSQSSFSKASSKPPPAVAQSKSGTPPPGAKTVRAHNPPPLLSKPKRPPPPGGEAAPEEAADNDSQNASAPAEATPAPPDPYDLPDDDDMPDEGYQAMLQEALRNAQVDGSTEDAQAPDGD